MPKKAQALLAYLALHSGRPIARGQLAALLWGHCGPEQARRSLRQCLMAVRVALGSGACVSLVSDGSTVVLDHVDVDVKKFEELGRSETLDDLEAASVLYRDEFLAGLQVNSVPFGEWITVERQRLASIMSDVLGRLALRHAVAGDRERAIEVARRLTLFDPLREDGHRLLMRLLASAGKRSAALKQYALCVDLLRRDLGVAAEAETAELAKAIGTARTPGKQEREPSGIASLQTATQRQPPAIPIAEAEFSLPDKTSIAVLPFVNLCHDPERTYFADGIAEDITIALGRIPWLFVIASGSTSGYRGGAVDLRQVGRELGIQYVLRGSVRQDRERLRIIVQLVDASRGHHLWAERFDGAPHDVFDIQDRVTASVAAMIGPALQSVEIERAQRKRTESLSAYDFYLQALMRFRTSLAGNREAINLLCKAIDIDSSYGAAYGLAARCLHLQTVFGWALPADSGIREGFRLARIAADIGKDDSEALWMAGHMLAQVAGETAYGLALIDKSLALNPNSASAWVSSCFVRAYHGDPGTALEHFNFAQRLNPRDSRHHVQRHAAAIAHFVAGRYEESARADHRAVNERPTYPPPLRLRAVTCALLGRLAEARTYVARLLAVNPDDTVSRMRAWLEPAMQGNLGALDKYLEGLRLAGLPEGSDR